MTITARIDPASRRELLSRLAGLAPEVLAAEIKPLVQQGAKDIKKDAVANLRRNGSRRSGSLIKSIKIGAFRKDRRKGMVWAAVGIGKGEYEYQGKRVIPRNYAHLVERGFISSRGPVAAKPFMRPAADRHLPKYLREIIEKLRRLVTR